MAKKNFTDSDFGGQLQDFIYIKDLTRDVTYIINKRWIYILVALVTFLINAGLIYILFKFLKRLELKKLSKTKIDEGQDPRNRIGIRGGDLVALVDNIDYPRFLAILYEILKITLTGKPSKLASSVVLLIVATIKLMWKKLTNELSPEGLALCLKAPSPVRVVDKGLRIAIIRLFPNAIYKSYFVIDKLILLYAAELRKRDFVQVFVSIFGLGFGRTLFNVAIMDFPQMVMKLLIIITAVSLVTGTVSAFLVSMLLTDPKMKLMMRIFGPIISTTLPIGSWTVFQLPAFQSMLISCSSEVEPLQRIDYLELPKEMENKLKMSSNSKEEYLAIENSESSPEIIVVDSKDSNPELPVEAVENSNIKKKSPLRGGTHIPLKERTRTLADLKDSDSPSPLYNEEIEERVRKVNERRIRNQRVQALLDEFEHFKILP